MSLLGFTDDMVLLRETAQYLQTMLKELQAEQMPEGLTRNINKSEVIRNTQAKNILFSLDNETIQ